MPTGRYIILTTGIMPVIMMNSKFGNSCVPDKTVDSCLDPELPRTVLGGGVGCGSRPAPFEGKKSVGTQLRWERHDKGQRGTRSGRDVGGSAATE
jgi:hypothetical protein